MYKLKYFTTGNGMCASDFENIDPEAEKRLDEKLKNGSESFGLYDVSEWYHCQSEIEGDEECKEQCEHCKEYYKGTDNGR